MKKIFPLLAFLTLLTFPGTGQLIFENHYGMPSMVQSPEVMAIHGEDLIVAGHTGLDTRGGNDILLQKMDRSGQILWKKNIGGAANEAAHDLIVLDDGYVLGGYTKTIGNGEKDFYLVKTDFEGKVLWERSYGTASIESCKSLTATSDGGFLLAGDVLVDEVQGQDWWILKVDGQGQEEWSVNYGNTSLDFVKVVEERSDGTFLIGGSIGDAKRSYRAMINIDQSGTIKWQLKLPDSGLNVFNSFDEIMELENEEILVLGNIGNATLTKIDEAGQLIWDEIYARGNKGSQGLGLQKLLGNKVCLYQRQAEQQNALLTIDLERGRVDFEKLFTRTAGEDETSYSFVASEDSYFFLNHKVVTNPFNEEEARGYSIHQYKKEGGLQWKKAEVSAYQPHRDWGHKVVETNTGDYIFSGYRVNRYTSKNTLLLSKAENDGTLAWETTIHEVDALPADLIATKDGGILMLNYLHPNEQGILELIKFDSEGARLWEKTFTAPGTSEFSNYGVSEVGVIRAMPDHGFMIAANTGSKVQLIRIDDQGNILFTKIKSTAYAIRDMIVTARGDLQLVALDQVISFDQEGTYIGVQDYGKMLSAYHLDFYSIAEAPQGEAWLYGVIRKKSTDPYQSILLKIAEDGTVLLQQMSGTHTKVNSRLKVVVQDDASILLFGSEVQPIHEFCDGLFFNIEREEYFSSALESGYVESRSAEGTYQWRETFGLGKGANFYDGFVDRQGEVVGIGWTYHLNSDDHYLVKFRPQGATDFETSPELITAITKVYPNPGNEAFQYEINAPADGELELRIFSSTGQLMTHKELLKSADKMTVGLDTQDFAPGIYYIQTRLNGQLLQTDKWMKLGNN